MASVFALRFNIFAEFLFIFCLVPAFVSGEEKLYLSIPDSVKLNPSISSIRSSQLSNVILNTLGFTAPVGQIWSGIERTQPFNHPKAAILIDVIGDSVLSLTPSKELKSFSLIHDEGISEIHQVVSCHLSNGLFGKSYINIGLWDQNKIPIVKADYLDLLGDITDDFDKFLLDSIKASSLNVSAVDSLLSELNFLIKLSQKVANDKDIKSNIRDLYVFRINTLNALQTDQRDAVTSVLEACLEYIKKNFGSAYNDQIVFLTEVVDAGKSRKTRGLLEESSAATAPPDISIRKQYNLAKQYTSEYQIAFAIILFVLILFILSTLTISLVMWNMDPGRDSIIYRMTSQRVKID